MFAMMRYTNTHALYFTSLHWQSRIFTYSGSCQRTWCRMHIWRLGSAHSCASEDCIL